MHIIVGSDLIVGFDGFAQNVTHSGKEKSPPSLPAVLQKCRLQQLNRLTVQIGEVSQTHYLFANANLVSSWDVVAAMPTTEKAFLSVCEKANFDILSLDIGNRLPFKIKFQQINQVVSRGIMVELSCDALLQGILLAYN